MLCWKLVLVRKSSAILPRVHLKSPSQILFRRFHTYIDIHINIMYRKRLLYCHNFVCWYMSGFQKRKSYYVLLITQLCKVSDVLNKMYVFTDWSFRFLSPTLLWDPRSWQLNVKHNIHTTFSNWIYFCMNCPIVYSHLLAYIRFSAYCLLMISHNDYLRDAVCSIRTNDTEDSYYW